MTGHVLGLFTTPVVCAAGLVLLWACDRANRRRKPISRTSALPPAAPVSPQGTGRPRGSANHPSGRRMGCPTSFTVREDGSLQEVWL